MLRNSRNVVGVITYAVPISAVKNISGLAAPEVGRIRTAAVTISNVNTTPLFSPFWTSVVIRDVTYLGPLVSITFVYMWNRSLVVAALTGAIGCESGWNPETVSLSRVRAGRTR